MKKILLLFGIVGLCVPAHAVITATNAINLQAIATTTVNGATNTVTGVALPNRTYLIQNTGIPGAATALTVNVQASFDGVNWTTVGTYNPTSTNATVDSFNPVVNNITAYTRVQAITTNTVTVGITTVHNQ